MEPEAVMFYDNGFRAFLFTKTILLTCKEAMGPETIMLTA